MDLGLISLTLLFTTFLRSRVRFFQRFLIPNALTAGFVPLRFYHFLAPRLGMGSEGLGSLVFHLLSLSVVAMSLLTWALSLIGPTGEQLATNFWGIAFTFAAIAAITIVLLKGFWVPILIVALAGGVVTTLTVVYTASRLFTDHRFDRAILFYGNMTGTLTTGVALLRVIDPDFETPMATDYMYGSGITFVLAIPLILLLNLPGYWRTTGDPLCLWLTLAGLGGCLLFSVVSYALLSGRRAFRSGLSLWMRE